MHELPGEAAASVTLTTDRRDLSPDGLAYRALIDEILERLVSEGTLTQEGVADATRLIEDGLQRFQHDQHRRHALSQIATTLALVAGHLEWSEAREMILRSVRSQQR